MQASGVRDWSPPEAWRVQHEALEGELHVGGVYLRLFLRNPRFPLRHPKAFLEVGGPIEPIDRDLAPYVSRHANYGRVTRCSVSTVLQFSHPIECLHL